LTKVGWDTRAEERTEWNKEEKEKEIIERVKDSMRREEEERIMKSKYNTKYKDIMVKKGNPRYLKEENLEELGKGEEIRILVKLRCGNLENANKYWLEEVSGRCVFCRKEKDTLKHYVGECVKTKEWFRELGDREEEILGKLRGEDIDRNKGRILRKLWREREKGKRKFWTEEQDKTREAEDRR